MDHGDINRVPVGGFNNVSSPSFQGESKLTIVSGMGGFQQQDFRYVTHGHGPQDSSSHWGTNLDPLECQGE